MRRRRLPAGLARLVACAAVAAIAVLAAPSAFAASTGELRKTILTGSYPDLTEEQKNLKEVPFAPGAPAVVLLSVRQDQWEARGSQLTKNVQYFRRVKILTQAGVEKYGNFKSFLFGDLRPETVKGRTILPDGTIVSADDLFQRASTDPGVRTLSIAFPQVQVGAILDVYYTMNADEGYGFYVWPFQVQEDLPVLECRYAIAPAPGLGWAPAFQSMPTTAPQRVKLANRREYYTWAFENIEPLPVEPNMPPAEALARVVYIRSLSYQGQGVALPLAESWATYAKRYSDDYKEWFKLKHAAIDQLVASATAGLADPVQKAEALRRALRSKVKYGFSGNQVKTPDDVLAVGHAPSWHIANVGLYMLRAAGLSAELLESRRRSEGIVPPQFPLPMLLDEYLLRVTLPAGVLYYAPAYDLPVGKLPADLRGATAIVLTEGTTAPIQLPPLTAAENKVVRTTTGRLTAEGKLTATTVATYALVPGDAWRRRLYDADDARRREMLREELPYRTAEVTSVTVDKLDDPLADLTITFAWEAENVLESAGDRVLFNGVLFDRVRMSDWAATTRQFVIDLGDPFDHTDKLEIELPPGVTDVKRADSARATVENLGHFEAWDATTPTKIVSRRAMRLDHSQFSAQGYGVIKNWFREVARFDEAPTVFRLPPP